MQLVATPAYSAGLYKADGTTWASYTGGNGQGTTTLTNASQTFLYIGASTTTNQFAEVDRLEIPFNTSSIPSNAIIDSATLEIFVTDNQNGLSATDAHLAMALVASSPASNSSPTTADYQAMGSVRFSTDIAYNNISTSVANTFTLNAAGLAGITKAGFTKLGIKFACDLDNTQPNWVSNGVSRLRNNFNDSNKYPKLTVNYHLPSGGGFFEFF